MARPYVVDSDVLVDFLRGRPESAPLVRTKVRPVLVPAVVVTELYAGVRGAAEMEQLDAVLSVLRVVPLHADVARAAGLFKQRFGKSHGVGLADALVAATVEAEGAELLTLHVRHYPMFPDLAPAYRQP